MKAFIDEYGTTCVVVLVVVILIGLVYFFREPLQGYYQQIIDNFFKKATEVASITNNIPMM